MRGLGLNPVVEPDWAMNSFFSSDATGTQKVGYAGITVALVLAMVLALLAPWIELPCDISPSTVEYGNHDYVNDPCVLVRYAQCAPLLDTNIATLETLTQT